VTQCDYQQFLRLNLMVTLKIGQRLGIRLMQCSITTQITRKCSKTALPESCVTKSAGNVIKAFQRQGSIIKKLMMPYSGGMKINH